MSFIDVSAYRVSVLCAHRNSPYWDLPVTVFDERRDARTFEGAGPVIAHPPCRGWSLMRGLSKAPPEELELARWCVRVVQRNGGVLEQPAHSRLWHVEGLPLPGKEGRGGFCVAVNQAGWGHEATKPTWLYVVGCRMLDLPELNYCGAQVNGSGAELTDQVRGLNPRAPYLNARAGKVNDLTPDRKDLTPSAFAWWLEELASRCRRSAC